jgi:hypothetical protein
MDFAPMKKWWVKLLLVLVFILLALGSWFIGTGTQSQGSLERYRKQLLAAGERLDIDAFIPPGVNPDKNGAALIDKANWYIAPRGGSLLSTNPPGPMEIVAPAKARVLWQEDEVVSVLSGRHATNSWDALELDLANQSAAVDLLQQAAAYSEFDFGIDYHQLSGPLPQLNKLRQAAALLSARVVDDLHRGDTASAVTNFQALLVIANAGKNDPLTGSQIIRSYLMQTVLPTQWELLQATNVTDEQLSILQTNWMELDFVKPIESTFQMTRSLLAANIKATRADNSRIGATPRPGLGMPSGGWDDFLRSVQSLKAGVGDVLWRESWSYDDELRFLEGYSVMVESARRARTDGNFKNALADRESKIIALGLNRTNANSLRAFLGGHVVEFDAARAVRSYANIFDRFVTTESWRQCVVTAIALKRHELRHGALPKELSALVPEFLPAVLNDSVDGQPLRYRLNEDGTFLLYSIGIDGIDNGGDATPIPPASSFPWQAGRDWVWPQPAVAAEVHYYYDHPPR